MPWEVVRGRYEQGHVKPFEGLPHCEGQDVLILIPKQDRSIGTDETWRQIKENMTREMPDLLRMTDEEKRQEFAQLSKIIAERMPYDSLEAFERAMRGDDYALVGY
jgi:predicted DNA-binding antitoxin AbrB/MazE fold protein